MILENQKIPNLRIIQPIQYRTVVSRGSGTIYACAVDKLSRLPLGTGQTVGMKGKSLATVPTSLKQGHLQWGFCQGNSIFIGYSKGLYRVYIYI